MNKVLTNTELKDFFDLCTKANDEQIAKLYDYVEVEHRKRISKNLDGKQNNISADLMSLDSIKERISKDKQAIEEFNQYNDACDEEDISGGD